MKEKESNVTGMVEKALGKDKKGPVKVNFPEKISEIRSFMGKQKVGNIEVDITEDKIISYLWRGFTLSFQGAGAVLTEEEKKANAATRKAKIAVEKEAKGLGLDLKALIEEAIARKKAQA